MADVRLDPMTDEEFTTYYREAIAAYAESHVKTRSWPANGAQERAAEEHAKLLPQGLATPGHHLYTARDDDHRVGTIWFAERPHGAGQVAYIYDVQIDPELRGNGYGTAVIQAVEEQALAIGLYTVRLHVFGDNRVARSLYHKLGYIETNVVMAKQLRANMT